MVEIRIYTYTRTAAAFSSFLNQNEVWAFEAVFLQGGSVKGPPWLSQWANSSLPATRNMLEGVCKPGKPWEPHRPHTHNRS